MLPALLCWTSLIGALAVVGLQYARADPNGPVLLLRLDGAVSPASADHIERGIARAAERGAAAIVLQVDTPGGLDKSMRAIIKAILASEVPVIGYVAPGGSRAASAGTYILYASHVAAMAPATNIGAATPVPLIPPHRQPARPAQDRGAGDEGSPAVPVRTAEDRKVLNDAVAYIRALAERRGRDADWAESAVRDAASASAKQALARGVIDVIAPDLPTLLAEVDGRVVATTTGERILHTRGAVVERVEPDWRNRFLAVIADPSVAYLLLLLGLGGLLFEGYSPGAIVPGVVGAICLLLALYALQMLPVNYVGLALIALGVALIVAETVVPAYGALGIGGVTAFVTGSVILMDTNVPGYAIALPVLVAVSLCAALLLVAILWLALRSRTRPVVSGREQMIGSLAKAVGDFQRFGSVRVHGERWQAMSDVPLAADQTVRITGIDGLVLVVEPVLPQGDP
jgi:membrane-bound serine protease (ClpP class)